MLWPLVLTLWPCSRCDVRLVSLAARLVRSWWRNVACWSRRIRSWAGNCHRDASPSWKLSLPCRRNTAKNSRAAKMVSPSLLDNVYCVMFLFRIFFKTHLVDSFCMVQNWMTLLFSWMRRWKACRAPSWFFSSSWRRPNNSWLKCPRAKELLAELVQAELHLPPLILLFKANLETLPAQLRGKTAEGCPTDPPMGIRLRGACPGPVCTGKQAVRMKITQHHPLCPAPPMVVCQNSPTTQKML